MDTLHSDLLIRIAELTPQPDVALCRLRLLNKRVHGLISPLRVTSVVAKELLSRPGLEPRHADVVRIIADECAKKIQAQREADADGRPLVSLALNSVTLEQRMLKTVKREIILSQLNSYRVVQRMPAMPLHPQPMFPQPMPAMYAPASSAVPLSRSPAPGPTKPVPRGAFLRGTPKAAEK